MPRKPMKTGYQIQTLRKRLDDLATEVLKMGQDGRMTIDESVEVLTKLTDALAVVDRIRFKQQRA